MKTCTACGQNKEYSQFPKQSSMKDGYRSICRECFNARERERERVRYENDEKFREKKIERASKRYQEKTEDIKQYARDRHHNVKKKELIESRRKAREEINKARVCPECGGSMIGLSLQNKYCSTACKRARDERILPHAEYVKKNKESYAKVRRQWEKKALKENPSMAIKKNMRQRLWSILNKKDARTDDILGYTSEEYRIFLLCRDTDAYLKWSKDRSNYHIDHIIPCAIYDAENREELRLCWNPRNLRIVDKETNVRKSDNLDMDLVKYYHISDLLPEHLKDRPIGA